MGRHNMATREELLPFHKKIILAVCENNRCVEDIPEMRDRLIAKYGESGFKETHTQFILESGKAYLKPWLPRERVGIFNVLGSTYFIDIKHSSTNEGRLKSRRSFYPHSNIEVVDDKTMVTIIDAKRGTRIVYTVQD